ncbi:MAG: hypothetical protein WCL50_07350 [Spirochaetota bacterium]
MGKSISSRLDDAKKWLKKNNEAGLNLKPAQAALASAQKAVEELEKLKVKIVETSAARKSAVLELTEAMGRVKTEKKLKAREIRLQSKLAALASQPAPEK